MRNFAAVGPECVRTLKSKRIFESAIQRTVQLRPKSKNSPKPSRIHWRLPVCIELHSPECHNGVRAMAPSAALDPIPLKGMGPWVRSLGRKSYGHCSPPHILHINQSLFNFTRTFYFWSDACSIRKKPLFRDSNRAVGRTTLTQTKKRYRWIALIKGFMLST